jgi:hypothetical protein
VHVSAEARGRLPRHRRDAARRRRSRHHRASRRLTCARRWRPTCGACAARGCAAMGQERAPGDRGCLLGVRADLLPLHWDLLCSELPRAKRSVPVARPPANGRPLATPATSTTSATSRATSSSPSGRCRRSAT